jgi:tRNA pseudouridine(55) synthase
MPPYALIEKEVGETPLQALERFRTTDARYAGVPMTYAGRLDPMASGQLLILIGDECTRREKYDCLNKTYEFEVLLGVESDTGDVLGLASDVSSFTSKDTDWENVVASLVGSHYLPYPVYSSRTVDGIPLFEHAHRDAGVERPVREMRVMQATYRGVREITNRELLREIEEKLDRVCVPDTNDFRIERIVPQWREVLATDAVFTILSITADVGSGTYIRALAPDLAKKLRTRGLAYSIHRSAIHL